MNPDEKTPSLGELHEQLVNANCELIEAQQSARTAEICVARATNMVNETQRRIDECVKALRNSAPRGTDWRNASQSRQQGETN